MSKFVAGVLFVFLLTSGSVQALERESYIGVSVLTPVQIQPTKERGDETYSLDLSYFLYTDRVTGLLSWEFGLEGTRRVALSLGPQLFFRPNSTLKPYGLAKFQVSLDPKGDVGWKMAVGVEWDWERWTKVNNLRLYADTGASQFFIDAAPDPLTLDLLRLGLSWSF